jgi:hypothetical protein
MSDLSVYILLAAGISGVLAWLLFPRRKSLGRPEHTYRADVNEDFPSPKHYRYFSQVRRALSAEDSTYLIESAPPQVAKQALRERRAVARGYLKGLREDFTDLARLGRVIASLSPEISRKQETQRLVLNLKFQLLYAVTLLRLTTGNLPIAELENLTAIVGRLSTRMHEAMMEIGAQTAGQNPDRISA